MTNHHKVRNLDFQIQIQFRSSQNVYHMKKLHLKWREGGAITWTRINKRDQEVFACRSISYQGSHVFNLKSLNKKETRLYNLQKQLYTYHHWSTLSPCSTDSTTEKSIGKQKWHIYFYCINLKEKNLLYSIFSVLGEKLAYL